MLIHCRTRFPHSIMSKHYPELSQLDRAVAFIRAGGVQGTNSSKKIECRIESFNALPNLTLCKTLWTIVIHYRLSLPI